MTENCPGRDRQTDRDSDGTGFEWLVLPLQWLVICDLASTSFSSAKFSWLFGCLIFLFFFFFFFFFFFLHLKKKNCFFLFCFVVVCLFVLFCFWFFFFFFTIKKLLRTVAYTNLSDSLLPYMLVVCLYTYNWVMYTCVFMALWTRKFCVEAFMRNSFHLSVHA